uniref:Ion_trans_2 domain-containing protein n=1 Tax=Globodera pallida TaxID=36090 RepID=A0A183CE80_GLOPA
SDDRGAIANGRIVAEERGRLGQKRGLAQFVRLVLPHLCLLLFTAIFISLVALTMHFVEGKNEREEQIKMSTDIERMRANFILHFRNKPIILGGELEAESRLFVDKLFKAAWTRGREGIPPPPSQYPPDNNLSSLTVWTVPNSLLFATSLVSRIGYGHIVPRTSEGKILSQLFALFGCPIFLVLIADIGKAIADLLQFSLRSLALWKKPSKKRLTDGEGGGKSVGEGHHRERESNEDGDDNRWHFETEERLSLSALLVLPFLIAFCTLTSVVYVHLEGWSWLDCFYFSFTSIYSIGFGDFAPSNSISVAFTICAIVIGMSIATLFGDFVGTEYIRNFHRIGRKAKNGWKMAVGKCCGRNLISQ